MKLENIETAEALIDRLHHYESVVEQTDHQIEHHMNDECTCPSCAIVTGDKEVWTAEMELFSANRDIATKLCEILRKKIELL